MPLFTSEIRKRAERAVDEYIDKIETEHDTEMKALEAKQEQERELLTENAVAKITNLFIVK